MKKGPPLNIMGFDRFVYPALKTNRNALFFIYIPLVFIAHTCTCITEICILKVFIIDHI